MGERMSNKKWEYTIKVNINTFNKLLTLKLHHRIDTFDELINHLLNGTLPPSLDIDLEDMELFN